MPGIAMELNVEVFYSATTKELVHNVNDFLGDIGDAVVVDIQYQMNEEGLSVLIVWKDS